MLRIVWNNLRHDRLRFAIAVVGVGFAITLITIEGAIFLGAIQSSSLLVRTCHADLWIAAPHTMTVDFGTVIPQRRMYQALGVKGVKRAGRLLIGFSSLKFPSGHEEPVIVVGADDDYDWLGIQSSRDRRVLSDRYILFDQRERYRFGKPNQPLQVGDRFELNGYQAEVAGFLTGRSSFVSTPYVFCRYQAALNFAGKDADQTTYVMVQCAPGQDVATVQRRLQQRLAGEAEVLTKADFISRTWHYWVLGTGMGMALGLSAALAFAVGLVIVGQTIFTSVLARLREYATLKAVGFDNRFVVSLVVLQSAAVVLAGYPLAILAAFSVARYAGQGGTAVVMHMTLGLVLSMIPVALVMCGLASVGAAAKVLHVAPAKVFR